MPFEIVALFGEVLLKEFTEHAIKLLSESDLPSSLLAELQLWAKTLPPEYARVEPTYLMDLAALHRKGFVGGQANVALAKTLAQLQIPSRQLWYRALQERREDAGDKLRAHPESYLTGNRNALYLANTEDVADVLDDAAGRLERVCIQNPVLVSAATFLTSRETAEAVKQVQATVETVRQSLERNRLAPAAPPPDHKKPWALQHFVKQTRSATLTGDARIVQGQWVVALFKPEPSGSWKDP